MNLNRPEKKKVSLKALFCQSIIVGFLLKLASNIKSKAENGFFGRIFTAYDKENQAYENSLIRTLLKRLRFTERVALPFKKAVASSFENSRVLAAVNRFIDSLLYSSQKVHGVFLVSFGLYTEIVFLIKNAFEKTAVGELDYTPLLTGAFLMIMALPLMFSSQPLAVSLCENRLTSKLLFDVIGARRESFTANKTKRDHMYTPFLIGMGCGLLTFFISPIYVIALICLLFFAYAVLAIPEFGVLCLIVSAPFAPTMLLVGLAMFVMFAFLIKLLRGKRSLKLNLTDIAILAFALVTLSGGIVSANRSGSMKPALVYTVFLLAYFLVANLIRTSEWLNKCLYGTLAAMLAVSAYGIYQYVFGTSATTWQDTDMFSDISGRVVSTFENPNVLAEYLIMLLPLAFALILTDKKRKSGAFSLVCFAAGAVCLIFTWSRGAWLGFLLGMFLFLLAYSEKFLILIFAGILGLPFASLVLPSSVMNRFMSIGNLADSSTSYRFNIWQGAVKMLKDTWLFGIGTGTAAFSEIYPKYSLSGIESAPHSHNLFLQLTVEHGIFALILFIAVMLLYVQGVLTFQKYETGRSKLVPAAMMCGIVAVLAQGMTDYIWYNYRVYLIFWLMIGLTTAARRCRMASKI